MRLRLPCQTVVFWIGFVMLLTQTSWSQTDTLGVQQVRGTKGTAASNGSDWPRFLGNGFDGSIENPAVAFDWTKPPRLAWSIEVGDGYGIGTVSNGRFFQLDTTRQFDVVTSRSAARERLRCFDFKSGSELWSKVNAFEYSDLLGYEDGPRTSPTVADGRVITFGVTGLLKCRGVSDGSELWSVDTNAKYGVVQNFFGVGSSPLVLDDKVIVMVGGSPLEDQEIPPMQLDRVTYNGTALVAFDLKTGQELWKSGNDLASYSSPRPLEINAKTYVLVFARTGLMLIDPKQGNVQWQFEHRAGLRDSVNAMVPVVDGNQVFISECYEVGSALLEVSPDARRVLWQDPPRDRRRQAMRSHWATPVLVDGFLYGCSGRNAPDSDFRCIRWETGEVQWVDQRRTRSSVARVGDHLIVLEERGLLQILKVNPQELDLVATWDLGLAEGKRAAIEYPCWAAPVIVGNKLLVRGTDRILCLELTAASSD